MMDQTIKTQWVEALRSGEYVQGTGRLHAEEKGKATWCCLGVLCDLAIKAGVEVETDTRLDCTEECCSENEERQRTIFVYDGRDDFLPPSVQDWAQLSHSNPEVVHPGLSHVRNTLSFMNDNGNDFAAIATLIEENF